MAMHTKEKLTAEDIESMWKIQGHNGGEAAVYKAPEDTHVVNENEMVTVMYDAGTLAVIDPDRDRVVETYPAGIEGGYAWGCAHGYDAAMGWETDGE